MQQEEKKKKKGGGNLNATENLSTGRPSPNHARSAWGEARPREGTFAHASGSSFLARESFKTFRQVGGGAIWPLGSVRRVDLMDSSTQHHILWDFSGKSPQACVVVPTFRFYIGRELCEGRFQRIK